MVSQIRRVLFSSFVRAQAVCLLARVGYLQIPHPDLGGGSSAADRMDVTRRQEEARRKERQGAHVRGRGVLSHTADIFN